MFSLVSSILNHHEKWSPVLDFNYCIGLLLKPKVVYLWNGLRTHEPGHTYMSRPVLGSS